MRSGTKIPTFLVSIIERLTSQFIRLSRESFLHWVRALTPGSPIWGIFGSLVEVFLDLLTFLPLSTDLHYITLYRSYWHYITSLLTLSYLIKLTKHVQFITRAHKSFHVQCYACQSVSLSLCIPSCMSVCSLYLCLSVRPPIYLCVACICPSIRRSICLSVYPSVL
jgi:hypothetical protein